MSLADYITLQHGDHDEKSQFPDCKIYAAIQKGAGNEKLIDIANEEDPDILEDYHWHLES